MNNLWQAKPFAECIEKVIYTPKIQRKDFLPDGIYPIVSQEDEFINGYWNNAADLFKVARPVVAFGDHTKILKYVDFDFVLGADGVKLLQPRDFLLPKFFFYQLQTANLDSLGYARHYKLLKELRLVYPALPEQQRIVGILDEALESIAAVRANAEKNLQNARALFKSHLQSVFNQRGKGWVERRIEEICTIKSGTTVDPALERATGEIPYLKVADMNHVKNETEVTSSTRFLSRVNTRATNIFPAGTTIFPKRGGAILTNKKRLTAVPICADLNIMGVTPDRRMLPKYLYFFFLNIDMRRIGSGTSIPQINNYDIEPLIISFPESLGQQTELVRTLEELARETKRLESLYQRKLAALEALKKSLLHQAFSGNL
jgi:type I restriction enzyme, S subunit